MVGFAGERAVVVGHHTVVDHRDEGGAQVGAVFVPLRRDEDHIIGLPLAWTARRVPQRWPLAVERGGLAAGVGGVFVGIENLQLVVAREEESTIAASLAVADHIDGGGEFQVDLKVLEWRRGLDGAPTHFHVSVLDLPLAARPPVHIRAVKQYHGVTGRRSEINFFKSERLYFYKHCCW